MDWEAYSSAFRAQAKATGFDDAYIGRCLNYAHALVIKGLPIIYSLEHFSQLVGIDQIYIKAVAYSPQRFYRNFEITKKAGGTRKIAEPLPNLKIIQRWILDNVLYKLPVSPYAKGFVPGKSIKDNARFHRKQEMVLCLDIDDFFPSISTKYIRNFFISCGYSKKLSYFLTRLCSLDGGLPQGAPTSPALSNLIFLSADKKIGDYCLEQKLRYTRYADDLSFSGEFHVGKLIRQIRKAISCAQLSLNESKTRLMRRHERQEITGVVVNEKLQAPRALRRNMRQATFYIEKYGLDAHLAKLGEHRSNYKYHLLGQATFILFLNPNDRDALRTISLFSTLRET